MLTCTVYSVMGDIVVEIHCLSHGPREVHRLVRRRSSGEAVHDPRHVLEILAHTALEVAGAYVLGIEGQAVTDECGL